MSYAERWKQLENQLRTARPEKDSGFIRDGIVSLPHWQQQHIRPLFIGKEAYGEGDWSITEHCMNQKPVDFCRKSPRSWQKTAHIAHALQHGCAAYDTSIRHKSEVYEALRTIAFINVGKFNGGKSTSPQRLAGLYNRNRLVLHEQIALIQPNVLIGWSTLGLFKADKEFTQRFGLDDLLWRKGRHLSYQLADGLLLVAARHPSYFKIKPADYVNGIVDVVREHLSTLRQEIPSW